MERIMSFYFGCFSFLSRSSPSQLCFLLLSTVFSSLPSPRKPFSSLWNLSLMFQGELLQKPSSEFLAQQKCMFSLEIQCLRSFWSWWLCLQPSRCVLRCPYLVLLSFSPVFTVPCNHPEISFVNHYSFISPFLTWLHTVLTRWLSGLMHRALLSLYLPCLFPYQLSATTSHLMRHLLRDILQGCESSVGATAWSSGEVCLSPTPCSAFFLGSWCSESSIEWTVCSQSRTLYPNLCPSLQERH